MGAQPKSRRVGPDVVEDDGGGGLVAGSGQVALEVALPPDGAGRPADVENGAVGLCLLELAARRLRCDAARGPECLRLRGAALGRHVDVRVGDGLTDRCPRGALSWVAACVRAAG